MAKPRRVDLGSQSLNERFEAIRADYDVCKTTRFRRSRAGVSGIGRSADYHFRSETQFLRAMELSRDIDRNDIVVGQAIDRLCDNIVQDGFTLDPQTGDTGLDAELSARWKLWAEDADACDIAGEHDFHDLERFTLRQTIVDGDVIHLPLAEAGAIETCEAHRCRTPSNTKRNVVLGVLLDGVTRKREEYWLTKEDVSIHNPVTKVSDTRQFPARQRDEITGRDERAVIHCYHPKRITQTRGFTALAPIAMATEHHDDLQFAQLIKARVAASYTILEESPIDLPGGGSGAGATTGEQGTEILSDGSSRTTEALGPGMRYRGRPGVKLTGFSPNVPNPEFFDHSLLILTFISINLGLPVQILLLDPTKTNFSGWRGAMDQAKMGFRKHQRWLEQSFHRRVYCWKVRQWMADDRMIEAYYDRMGRDVFSHRWHKPRWPYIEPISDSQAGLLRVRNLQTSPRRLAAEIGFEFEEIRRETMQDNEETIRQAKQGAARLNKEFGEGDPVSWRDVLCPPTPDRVSGQIATGSQAAAATEPTEKT
jgi:lambda family phage portal protein